MVLWVDTAERKYGLEEDSSYTDNDSKAVEHTIDGNVTVEIGANETAQSALTASTLFILSPAATGIPLMIYYIVLTAVVWAVVAVVQRWQTLPEQARGTLPG